ncbi:hypothetical protein [Bacillus sp. REN16]|uniref:hypothetical protein n=1 Tax=Bacillus sp. REN16 TaxID=2887296 RepID=UPI001E4D3C02|nr:hypothetical protein [Bacillus sp. REN16]MCC3355512.1 hypothetical protein [Bacillus sp. REN16]
MEQYLMLGVIAIITLAFGIILKSKKVFFTQLGILLVIVLLKDSIQSFLYIPLSVLQILVTALVLIRYKKAVDRNYTLILEKTHKIPRNLTKGGDLGSQTSFFEKN